MGRTGTGRTGVTRTWWRSPHGGRAVSGGLTALLAVAVACQPAVAAASSRSAAAAAATAAPTVTVKGVIPYKPDPSETAGTPASASCSRILKGLYLGLYVSELAAFKADGAPDAANLLAHWWAGSGQAVNYGPASDLSPKAAAFPAFQAMNRKVQAYVRQQLAKGITSISVPASPGYSSTAQRPLVLMNFNNVTDFPSLYWAFRATQGIRLTGTLKDQGGKYTGQLTYVISDTYGFRGDDTSRLTGPFTRAMNYLQTNCGRPKYGTGPLWFSDSLTVPVKFSAAGG
jgi:hypothetical protein